MSVLLSQNKIRCSKTAFIAMVRRVLESSSNQGAKLAALFGRFAMVRARQLSDHHSMGMLPRITLDEEYDAKLEKLLDGVTEQLSAVDLKVKVQSLLQEKHLRKDVIEDNMRRIASGTEDDRGDW